MEEEHKERISDEKKARKEEHAAIMDKVNTKLDTFMNQVLKKIGGGGGDAAPAGGEKKA